MPYETLVARFWLCVRRVPQSHCRRQSRDKRQGLWGRECRGLVPIHPRVSILDPVFLRPDPKWRSKQRRTIAILACACANDVPMEFTLV